MTTSVIAFPHVVLKRYMCLLSKLEIMAIVDKHQMSFDKFM